MNFQTPGPLFSSESLMVQLIGEWSDRYLVSISKFVKIERSSSLQRKKSSLARFWEIPWHQLYFFVVGLYILHPSERDSVPIMSVMALVIFGLFCET